MIDALSRFYKINLSKGDDFITIERNLIMLKSYVDIQQMRFVGEFDYIYNVDPDILQWKILKLTLQPLIENALQHGLGTSGRLEIWIFEDPRRQYGVIIVRDYGEGLSREKLEELNRPLGAEDSKKTRNGIGLRYVRSMLETVYGSEAILDVNSTRGRGTKVTILLPLVRDDGKEGEIFD